MLPLRLAIAITIHKSQGMTIPRLKANLGDSELHPNGTFTVLSRLPCLRGLALEKPLSLDRLYKVNHSRAILDRKQYEAKKWPALEANTVVHMRGVTRDLLCSRRTRDAVAPMPSLDVSVQSLAMIAVNGLSLAQYTANAGHQ